MVVVLNEICAAFQNYTRLYLLFSDNWVSCSVQSSKHHRGKIICGTPRLCIHSPFHWNIRRWWEMICDWAQLSDVWGANFSFLIETARVTEKWHLPIDHTFRCFRFLRSLSVTYRNLLRASFESCSMVGQVCHGQYQTNICWALYLLQDIPFCHLRHG